MSEVHTVTTWEHEEGIVLVTLAGLGSRIFLPRPLGHTPGASG